MANRGYTQVLEELRSIKEKHGGITTKIGIMADALAWGYGTARTNHYLEKKLYHADDLESVVIELADAWDRQDFLSGALHTAQKFYIPEEKKS